VGLDGSPLLAREVLQTPPRGVERLADGHTGVAMDALDPGALEDEVRERVSWLEQE
jgi:hypothetical protein